MAEAKLDDTGQIQLEMVLKNCRWWLSVNP